MQQRPSEGLHGLVGVVVCAGGTGEQWGIDGVSLPAARDFIKAAEQTAV